jgi:CheY-like chemotaxis protein
MSDHKGTVILVVERDALFGENLFNALKDAGYECILVKNQKEVISKMREVKPHLVVVDVSDPQINGYDILENKKSDTALGAIPALAISTVPGTFDAKRITSAGVTDTLVDVKLYPGTVLKEVDRMVEAHQRNQNASPHAVLRGKRILWVEDDKFIGNILKKRFSGYDALFDLARSGDEAFAFLAKNIPNIIILDLVLPGMSGFDILKKIRDEAALGKVPVIIFSNQNQSADLERAKILGAQKFFVKAAVSLDQITKEVEELLKA